MPQGEPGSYNVSVRGSLPDGDIIKMDLELEECHTAEVLNATLRSTLEEIFECKYHYTVGDIDETLHYDGGIFS